MKEKIDFEFIKKRITRIVIFFTLSLITILILTYLMFGLLSGTRAFTGYHSLWTHTQNKALIHLISYTHSGEISEFEQFEDNLAIMDGIQNALYELNMDNFDYELTKQHFKTTSLYISQIEEKINHLHFLRNFSAFENALNKWENYHQNSEHLREIAERAKLQIESGEMDDFSRNQILFLAQNLNTILVENQIELLNDMNEASENLSFYSFSVLLFLSLTVFIIFGGLIFNWQKSLNVLKNVYAELDRIASFPKVNPNPIIVMNKNGIISYINSAASSLFGSASTLENDQELHKKLLDHCQELSGSDKTTLSAEFEFNSSYYLINAFLIDRHTSTHFYFIDITDRKRLESELQNSLHEKTTLLSEVHHRVKNNLAVAIGFLEIEKSNQPAGIQNRRLYKRSISRLHSIAAIHNLLYNQKEFSKISLSVFFDTISEMLKKQFTDVRICTDFSNDFNGQQININQALPCGMLINELFASIQAPRAEIKISVRLIKNTVHIHLKSDTNMLFSFLDSESDSKIVNILHQQLQSDSLETDENQQSLQFSFKIRDQRGSGNALL